MSLTLYYHPLSSFCQKVLTALYERTRAYLRRGPDLAGADRYLRFHLAAFGRAHLSQSEHRALVEACRRRAADRAVAILTRHITTAGDHLPAFLAAR